MYGPGFARAFSCLFFRKMALLLKYKGENIAVPFQSGSFGFLFSWVELALVC